MMLSFGNLAVLKFQTGKYMAYIAFGISKHYYSPICPSKCQPSGLSPALFLEGVCRRARGASFERWANPNHDF